VNMEEAKRRLLADRQTREAYEHPPLALALARAVVQRKHALNMSQVELAERLGTSQTQVWRIESGQANLTIDTLQRLQEVLQVAVEVHA